VNPTVEVVIHRNRNGSVLAFADRDRAARLLEDHRGVLQSLYGLIDRRHGSVGIGGATYSWRYLSPSRHTSMCSPS
jgi:hypothetical protein